MIKNTQTNISVMTDGLKQLTALVKQSARFYLEALGEHQTSANLHTTLMSMCEQALIAEVMVATDGNLTRAAVELAKDWRTDKYLRRLEALMAVGDKSNSYIISGTGDVLEPEGDVIGIGSGGNYALAAGKVLIAVSYTHLTLPTKRIV